MRAEPHSPDSFLRHLWRLGARRLRRVSFRRNRSTLWSLTQRGTALNVHVAYREAPAEILDAFAVLARSGGRAGAGAARARRTVRSWPGVARAIRSIRREDAERSAAEGARRSAVRCSGTPEQRAWLRAAYGHLNGARFGDLLPAGLPLRFSRRMRSSLGHFRPGPDSDGRPVCLEIALNLDLLLAGNEGLLVDTLLHEMAHAADWLVDGARGHGPSWRRWADRAGCAPRTRHTGGFRRRRRRSDAVTRVPPPATELVAAPRAAPSPPPRSGPR